MRSILLALGLIIATGAAPAAQEGDTPLPSFTMVDSGGRTTTSTELVAGRRAVMVFVRPSCRPCEQLLNALARVRDVPVPSGLVVVVESGAEGAAAFAARALPERLADAPVFADPNGEARAKLELNALPTVVGVEGGRISWTYTGVPDRSLLQSLMRTWMGEQEGAR